MKPKRRRLVLVSVGLLALFGAAALVLTALEDNLVFFYSPSDLAERPQPPANAFRLGGLVEEGSIERSSDGITTTFRITDMANSVSVSYSGILPDLFREGQGVVTEGTLGSDGLFTAREVLAKHDENYMPKEVADALKEAGQWKHFEGEASSK